MHILDNVPLSPYSTMHLGGSAAYLTEISSRDELVEALSWAEAQKLPVIMIGSGSNIYWRDEGFNGLVLVNKVVRYEDYAEDDLNHYVTIGAGEIWDSVVERTVQAGLTGIESLSFIPGTAGATPVQNVGAYGQEIAQTLVSIEAYDTQAHAFVTVPASDCALGYRTSRFKVGADKGRFFITAITLHLLHDNPEPLLYQSLYQSLRKYFEEHRIDTYTPQIVRDAIIDIRTHKLPDPDVVANNGSFFANPVIDETKFVEIQNAYPDIPHWLQDDGLIKIPGAWLIEQAGFKDFHDAATGMATWPTQPLVLINEHAQHTSDLEAFKQKIVQTIAQKFGITLEQEPECLP